MDEIGCTNLKYWNVNNEKQTFERYIELAGVRTPRCRGFCFGLGAFAICIWAGRKEAKSSTGNMPLQILSSRISCAAARATPPSSGLFEVTSGGCITTVC